MTDHGRPLTVDDAGPPSAAKHPILTRFLYGQFANLFKMSLWWISLAPLTFALLDNSSTAVGAGRIVYNVAMCMLSPIGAIIVERYPAKKILIYAALVRFVLWCLCLPGVWAMQVTSDTKLFTEVFACLCIILFFDGCAVALSSLLDVDVCGLDIVAGTYGIEVDEAARNSFNSKSEMFFSLSFIFFAPLMAWGGLLYREAVRKAEPTWADDAVASGTLASVFVVTFLVGTLWQVFFFLRMPNPPEAPPPESINDDEPPPPPPSFCTKVGEALGELRAGLSIFYEYPPVLFRVLFLGLEIAVEDASIVVIASQCGVKLPWMGNRDAVEGNIWTAMLVCAGKIGAAVASFVMLKTFKPPESRRGFWPMFALVAAAAVSSGGFPLTIYLQENGHIEDNAARIIFFTSFLLFFFLSTMPKVGFMCLLQTMVSSIPNGHRAFGFIAIVATATDAVIIMAMTSFFETMTMQMALVACFGIMIGHGALELLLGPLLVLRDGDGGDDAGGAAGKREDGLGESLMMRDSPRNDLTASDTNTMRTFSKERSSSLLADD